MHWHWQEDLKAVNVCLRSVLSSGHSEDPGPRLPTLSDLSVTSVSRNICTDLGKQSILHSVSIVTQQSNSHLIPLLTDPLLRRICGRLFYVD